MNQINFTDEQILKIKEAELERVKRYFETPESSKWNYIRQLETEILELKKKISESEMNQN